MKTMASGPISSWLIEWEENMETVTDYFLPPPWALKSLWTVSAPMKLKAT